MALAAGAIVKHTGREESEKEKEGVCMRDPQPLLCATPIASLWYVSPVGRGRRVSPPVPPASNVVLPMSVAEDGQLWILTEDGVTRLTERSDSRGQAVDR